MKDIIRQRIQSRERHLRRRERKLAGIFTGETDAVAAFSEKRGIASRERTSKHSLERETAVLESFPLDESRKGQKIKHRVRSVVLHLATMEQQVYPEKRIPGASNGSDCWRYNFKIASKGASVQEGGF